jgi:hypothetical protein
MAAGYTDAPKIYINEDLECQLPIDRSRLGGAYDRGLLYRGDIARVARGRTVPITGATTSACLDDSRDYFEWAL